MSREVLIDTPENIALEYELAGLGTRFIAATLDLFILGVSFIASIILVAILGWALQFLAATEHWGWLNHALVTAGLFVDALMIIFSFVLFCGYFIYFEYRWNGQTPGKRSSSLRVMREGGYPVDFYSVILRNLLRIIDFLPGAYFIGMISIMVSPTYQRLGDLVGGTIVVKQRAPRNLINLLQATRLQPEHLDREALAMMVREADLLTPEQYQAVRHFTERRRSLTNWNAIQQSASVLAIPLMERLHIVPPQGVSAVNYADVLEYLAVAYETARRPKEMRAATVAGASETSPLLAGPVSRVPMVDTL